MIFGASAQGEPGLVQERPAQGGPEQAQGELEQGGRGPVQERPEQREPESTHKGLAEGEPEPKEVEQVGQRKGGPKQGEPGPEQKRSRPAKGGPKHREHSPEQEEIGCEQEQKPAIGREEGGPVYRELGPVSGGPGSTEGCSKQEVLVQIRREQLPSQGEPEPIQKASAQGELIPTKQGGSVQGEPVPAQEESGPTQEEPEPTKWGSAPRKPGPKQKELKPETEHKKGLDFARKQSDSEEEDDSFFNKEVESVPESQQSTIHPLDLQMAVLHCSDDFLKQKIVTKLSQCQYALPLLVPDPFTGDIECPLWTFRQIKKTWKKTETKEGSKVVTMKSMPICKAETPMVFCFRLGSLSGSKSQLINTLINAPTTPSSTETVPAAPKVVFCLME
ncbi:hypothetical protein WMY93_027656 [Mugilogobius chulae]|uniref:Up-regulator of cell proliferation-like domain-containing protein n=1 Tax=Mugilogobius chulae TaxID=88201 RepID=A0AAW0MY52_9GOBI